MRDLLREAPRYQHLPRAAQHLGVRWLADVLDQRIPALVERALDLSPGQEVVMGLGQGFRSDRYRLRGRSVGSSK